MKRLACLDRQGLWFHGEAGLVNVQPRDDFYDGTAFTIGQFLGIAQSWHIDQLWIHRSVIDQYEPVVMRAPEWNIWPAMPTISGWYHAYRPGQPGAGVELAIPAWPVGQESEMLWNKAPTGADLLTQVHTYNMALRFDYRWTPGATGSALMRAVHGGGQSTDRRYTRLDTPQEPPPPALSSPEPGRDIKWTRGLTEDESGMRYLHAYDKNSAYLGACAGLELGLGEWEHTKEQDGLIAQGGHVNPGYYHVDEVVGDHTQPLPAWFDPDGRLAGPTEEPKIWVMAAMVNTAVDAGYWVHWDESYTWPMHSRVLAPWQARLRVARQELRDMPLPLSVLKLTYSMGIGSLDGWWRREKTAPDMLYRPDWRHMVIAQAAANVWRDTLRAVRNGVHVVAVATDCLYVVTDMLAIEAAQAAGLKMGPNIGEYKIAQDSVPLDGALIDIFEDESIGKLARYLSKRRREDAVQPMGGSADGAAAQN